MLRIHLMQNRFGLSDPATEEALDENMAIGRFAQLSLVNGLPDKSTILRFRHLWEHNDLAPKLFAAINRHLEDHGMLLLSGTIVDAMINHALSSTKNTEKQRDPEMHQTKKDNQRYFGMKAHIGVDAEGGLVHTVVTTAANAADVTSTSNLLRGNEDAVFGELSATRR